MEVAGAIVVTALISESIPIPLLGHGLFPAKVKLIKRPVSNNIPACLVPHNNDIKIQLLSGTLNPKKVAPRNPRESLGTQRNPREFQITSENFKEFYRILLNTIYPKNQGSSYTTR